MALYLTKLVNGQVQKLRVSPTKALYRGFWAVIVGGFAGTSVTCNGVTKFIGSSERVAFNIITPGTYTFTATRQGSTITKEVVLNDGMEEYIINLSMFIGMQVLEYIESTGTQWIDTGVVYSSANHKSVVKFSHVSSGSDNAPWWVWGSDSVLTTNGSRSGSVALKSDNNTLGIGVGEVTGGGSPYTISNPTVPITVDVETKDNNTFSVSVNGLSIYDNISFNGSCYGTSSEVLFGINVKGTIQQKTSTKIYAAQFYDNGILVRDFVPIRDDTGRGALYDKVTQQIFYNSGTGDFICGPNKPYTRIQYLESTGTQYIDTGYIFNNVLNARIILDGSFNGTASQWNGIGLGGSTFGGPHIGLGKSDHEFAYAAGVGDQRTGVVGNFNQRYLFDLNIPESIYMVYDTNNNVLVNVYPIIKQNRVGQYSALIFGYYGNPSTDGGPYKIRAMTIYSVKFYNAGSIVRDFIPVLDTNGVPCMYDKVTEQFFYNQGTGQFIAGPDK